MTPVLMMLSREVRRVPLDWEHPRDERGRYIGLHDRAYADEAAEWDADKAAWDRDEFPDYADAESRTMTYEEWSGERPDEADYMPTFPPDATLGICMYEEVSEGTPISPIFEDSDEGRTAMATWLASNPRGAITDGMTADDWRGIIDGGLGTKDIHTGMVEVRPKKGAK
jgi:hypothetical protein